MTMFGIPAAGMERYTAPDGIVMRKWPIIDVHLHAYPADMAIDPSLVNPITGKAPRIRNGEEHLQACLAEMRRLNIVKAVVSGGSGDRLAAAAHWLAAAPYRVIPGAGVRGS